MHYNMLNKYRLSTYCGLLLLSQGNSREQRGQYPCVPVAYTQGCDWGSLWLTGSHSPHRQFSAMSLQ